LDYLYTKWKSKAKCLSEEKIEIFIRDHKSIFKRMHQMSPQAEITKNKTALRNPKNRKATTSIKIDIYRTKTLFIYAIKDTCVGS